GIAGGVDTQERLAGHLPRESEVSRPAGKVRLPGNGTLLSRVAQPPVGAHLSGDIVVGVQVDVLARQTRRLDLTRGRVDEGLRRARCIAAKAEADPKRPAAVIEDADVDAALVEFRGGVLLRPIADVRIGSAALER